MTSVIALTETWLAKDTENLYEPPLFNLLYSPSGGLVLYIENNLFRLN